MPILRSRFLSKTNFRVLTSPLYGLLRTWISLTLSCISCVRDFKFKSEGTYSFCNGFTYCLRHWRSFLLFLPKDVVFEKLSFSWVYNADRLWRPELKSSKEDLQCLIRLVVIFTLYWFLLVKYEEICQPILGVRMENCLFTWYPKKAKIIWNRVLSPNNIIYDITIFLDG